MKILGMALADFFVPKSVAIVGASHEEGKIGHVIVKNLLSSYKGKIFPVNPNSKEILGKTCYPSLTAIPCKVDLVMIVVPAPLVLGILDDVKKIGTRSVIIVSAGFKEVGEFKLEQRLIAKLKTHKIRCIGPNCLGLLNMDIDFDSLFLPADKVRRPKKGDISFISQSGALGAAVLDLAAKEGYGFSKFVSYGNATDIDEIDLLEYLEKDSSTKVIALYIEAVKDGKRFLETAKRISKTKPVIIIKGGVTKAGSAAALSHTGSLAGEAQVYFGAFKQAGLVTASNLEELFDFTKLFEKLEVRPQGPNIQIITNGGGYGILTADAVSSVGLSLAQPSEQTKKRLISVFPPQVIVKNPIDLLGDATARRYHDAIQTCQSDKNIDLILVVVLPQTPLVDIQSVVDVLAVQNNKKQKPIVVVTTGSDLADRLREMLSNKGIACFDFPERAVKAIKAMIDYQD